MTADEPKWEPWMEKALADEKAAFIYFQTKHGKLRADAEVLWRNIGEPSFRKHLSAGMIYPPGYEKHREKPASKQAVTEPSQNVSLNQMLSGMHELTHDDLIDMWQQAQTMPEPDRQKAIQQITRLSKEFESRPAQMIVSILLEAA
jgi:hypothetical protein